MADLRHLSVSGGLALAAGLPGWAALLAGGAWLNLPGYCAGGARALAPGWDGVALTLILNSPEGLAAAWATMVAAMMAPLLIRPLGHVWRSSATPAPAATLFLLGYGLVWMAMGALLVAIVILLRAFAPGGAFAIALVAALAWQLMPARRAFLERCGARPPLGNDAAALGFGLFHGAQCAGVCWALMALPLTVDSGHFAAMVLVALFLFAERLSAPEAASLAPVPTPARPATQATP